MRRLTTAVYKGYLKIPGEKHKADIYALAPGDALWVDEGEPLTVTPEMARGAEYTYCLIWREGRVLAEFKLPDGGLAAQPIKPDPLPKRKRDDPSDTDGTGSREDRGPARHDHKRDPSVGTQRSARTARPAPLLADEGEGSAPTDRTGGAKKGRRTRTPDLL